MWWEMKIKTIITLFWNGTDRTWNFKSLRWIQLWGLNLKWQLLFQISGYSLWMCFCTEQGHWHPDLTLQDESDPASFWGPWQSSHWLQRQSIMPNTGRHYFWRAVFLETADICMLDYTDKTKHLFTCDLSWCIWRGLHLYSPLGANFNLSMGLWQIFMDNIYFTKDKDLQYQAVIPGQIFHSCYSPRSHPR